MNISLLITLTLLSQTNVQADQEPLGRLFFTPQERAALDRQRQNHNFQANERSQTVNGEVRRSDGSHIRWVNGEANWNISGSQPVPVGDTYNPGTGEYQSLLGRRPNYY